MCHLHLSRTTHPVQAARSSLPSRTSQKSHTHLSGSRRVMSDHFSLLVMCNHHKPKASELARVYEAHLLCPLRRRTSVAMRQPNTSSGTTLTASRPSITAV